MYCLSCGRELEEGYLFCDYCGAPVPQIKESNVPKETDDTSDHYFELYPEPEMHSSEQRKSEFNPAYQHSSLHCASCGMELLEGSLFCDYCGARVDSATKMNKKNSPQNSSVSTVKSVARCNQCGTELPEGSMFCDHCGARINNETQSPKSITTAPDGTDDLLRRRNDIEDSHCGLIRCRYCGEMIDDDSVFCEICGKKV